MRTTLGHLAMLAVSILLTLLGVLAAIAVASNTSLTISGGDWSMGTDTSYCGVYWPHLDFYCQSGR